MTHADLKEAAEKATPGPWDGSANEGFVTCPTGNIADVYDGWNGRTVNDPFDAAQARANATFIALANPSSILSLIEENERMREALTPFAEFNTKIDAHPDAAKTPDDYCIHDGLKVGDFRRAFSALKEKP